MKKLKMLDQNRRAQEAGSVIKSLPTTLDSRKFIYYYTDMGTQRYHTLEPLLSVDFFLTVSLRWALLRLREASSRRQKNIRIKPYTP